MSEAKGQRNVILTIKNLEKYSKTIPFVVLPASLSQHVTNKTSGFLDHGIHFSSVTFPLENMRWHKRIVVRAALTFKLGDRVPTAHASNFIEIIILRLFVPILTYTLFISFYNLYLPTKPLIKNCI